jgi:hypothetical protein
MSVQIVNALTNQLVLYHYDFGHGDRASRLSLRGMRQLAKFAPRALALGRPIVIEPSPGMPVRDEARRDSVIETLAELYPNAGEFWADGRHVIVALPVEPGLRGEEALFIDDNLLDRTQSGSPPAFGSENADFGASSSASSVPLY